MLLTLVLGPGLVTNLVFKENWSRPRPIDVAEFGGASISARGGIRAATARKNCSFVAGEPSGAFWTLAPAALTPPQWRALAYGGSLAFGAAVGVLRMAAGAHFFSDVVFAGVFTFLVIWLTHGWLYRWPRTRITDEAVARALELGRAERTSRDGAKSDPCKMCADIRSREIRAARLNIGAMNCELPHARWLRPSLALPASRMPSAIPAAERWRLTCASS